MNEVYTVENTETGEIYRGGWGGRISTGKVYAAKSPAVVARDKLNTSGHTDVWVIKRWSLHLEEVYTP